MVHHDQLLIGGVRVPARGSESLEVVDPATEEVVGTLVPASLDDVASAVTAAAEAAPSMAGTAVEERRAMLDRLLGAYEERIDDLVSAVVDEIGLPEGFARDEQVESGRLHVAGTRDALDEVRFRQLRGSTLVERRPVGVSALITPWNWPLNQIALKVAPALAAGCSSVLKPSEFSPRQTDLFIEIVLAAQLPDGAVNIINGTGPVVGAALVDRPEVDAVSFTGSTAAGITVTRAAADRVRPVALELGGKSPALVLDDAPLAEAVTAVVNGCFSNNGQSCDAPTRLLVPRAHLDEAVDVVTEACRAMVVGDPRTNPDVTVGPVINGRQFDRIQTLLNRAMSESTLIIGGPGRPEGLDRGWFIQPTAFVCQSPEETIATEEVFGPVLAVVAFDDDDQAVSMANDSRYGLAAYVFSADRERAVSIGRRLSAGQVHLNGPHFDPSAPFGGRKMSGIGREYGVWGIEEYLEPVALLAPEADYFQPF